MVSARPNHRIAPGIGAHLRILAITDLHAHLMDFDYSRDQRAPGTGLVSLADRIAQARREAPNTLLLDNGDTFQGSALGEALIAERRERDHKAEPHPIVAALSAVGVDAAVPGNHDFNFGIEVLQDLVRQAAYPFVLTNLVARRGATPGEDCALFPTTLLMPRRISDAEGREHDLKIGIIGLVPPQTLCWDEDHLRGQAEIREAREAAQYWAQDLRLKGADLVIALCHGGLGDPAPSPGAEDVARCIARLPGIDAVVAGHRHEVGAEDAQEGAAPIVSAGSHGSHLGQIDLHLTQDPARPGWHIAASATALWPATASPGPAAQEIIRIAAPAHARIRACMTEAIGQTDIPLHSYFAGVLPAAAAELIAEAQADAVRAGLADSAYADLPVLSSAALYKTGGALGFEAYTDIPAGPILRRHLHDLYPFPNTLAAMRTDGRGIRDWLEHAARIYAERAQDRSAAPLFAPQAVGYEFDIVHGIEFEIDLEQPVGARIGELKLATGAPLRDETPVILATTNYRVSGSGGYPILDVVYRSQRLVRDIMAAHVAKRGRITAGPRPSWRLVGRAGTERYFTTTTEARKYLPQTPLRERHREEDRAEDGTEDRRLRLALTF
ncbi:Trifunctional nucleotide phosphoesterase protein YfkN precursor [Roseivivax sp. THAF40]|uniref:bifunctional metallophosphatase/5'-nucleotidase n=1 Tax=unclassified Roseivivax TaxID=2639302 RepID=UPI0012688639|nr:MULTISPECIES: 5'-nucleotidase C-terminal domain-containing protein [unclassified Roseivivax]QFS81590.1 Trifunctional nucleotide phosphoesterase protein YfkN precursor [Roseivivax sp. THAF197b]QFT45319.1 Trifunctional nucleotide phosphoesterase protein YfkN precursor [Roseivivax sp. THAF40]